MKKVLFMVLSAMLVISFLTFTVLAASVTLDFSSADQARHFESITNGLDKWAVENGQFTATNPRGDSAVQENWMNVTTFKTAKLPKDFTIEFDLTQKDNSFFALAFGVKDPLVTFQDQDSYALLLWNKMTEMKPRLALTQCFADAAKQDFAEVGASGGTVSEAFPNHVKIVKAGANVKVYVKNDDDAYSAKADGVTALIDVNIDNVDGYIQLYSGNGQCQIDNLSIVADGVNLTLPVDKKDNSATETKTAETKTTETKTTETKTTGASTNNPKTGDIGTVMFAITAVGSVSVAGLLSKKRK